MGRDEQPTKPGKKRREKLRLERSQGQKSRAGKRVVEWSENSMPKSSRALRPSDQTREAVKKRADLTQRVLRLVSKLPLNAAELANKLQLGQSDRAMLRSLLKELETDGKIARIKRDRYILPSEADLVTGTIQFHSNGSAHLLAEGFTGPDLYISPENTSTAMHGDKVVVRLLPPREESLWRPGSKGPSLRREGRVIRILERANDCIVGTLQRSKNFFYVVADDPRFPHNLYVPEPKHPVAAKVGDKVVARVETWPSRHVNPEGVVIENLGQAGQPGVDMLGILRKYRLPERFPEDVLREARKQSTRQPLDDAQGREDHRADLVITIDPDDARDFDDAIYVERIRSGWAVAVHIADVSHYVKPKSSLDREALARGNSVYLPDRVIPMLPEELSNGICSLQPNEDRLVFSVFVEVGKNGIVKRWRFARSIIRSKMRLTYRQALAILEKPPTNEVEERVHVAWECASALRKRRFEAGSLDLDFPETKVWVDSNGYPVRIEKVENDISHQLIEELMLLANEVVARELRMNKQPTIYRVHEAPDEERLLEFREIALMYGARVGDLSNRTELQKLLAGIRGETYEYALKLALLKSLKRARYDESPLGHYGLAKSNYLHFTSPIRRYADLVAHRSLAKHLGFVKSGPDSASLPAIAEHISTTERTATDAEREAVKLKKLEYFHMQISERRGEVFSARIIDVRNFGLFVELPDYLITGLIHVSALDDDFYVFDAARGIFQGRRSRKVYAVGQSLDVIVSRVDLFKQQIDFRPADQMQKVVG